MGLTVVLLIAVLINNEVRNNAVRTFFGGSVQPSELAKLATIIYLSVWLYSETREPARFSVGIVPAGFHPGRNRWFDFSRA